MRTLKKAVAIIVTIVAFLSVFLIVLSYNTLVTVTVPDTIITYKANYIEFDDLYGDNLIYTEKVRLTYGNYTLESIDSVGSMYYDGDIDDYDVSKNRVKFERYRSNVYDVDSNVQYDEGVPIYADIYIYKQPETTSSGLAVFSVELEGYYIEFSFEQLSLNSTYTLNYQEYMRDNTPSLQRPQKPKYEGENTIEVVRHFFEYVGSSVEYLFAKLEYYSNYVTFYVQDFAVLFKFI